VLVWRLVVVCTAPLTLEFHLLPKVALEVVGAREPVSAHRPEDVEVEPENRECNRQIH
jgi:hypothetical protein